MAVQKKKGKPPKKKVINYQLWNWTAPRKTAARLLSTGLYSQQEIAKELRVSEEAISRWKQYPAFMKEVERLTFLQENATRAGVVRQALKALDIKKDYIAEDRSTFLDYLEFIIKVIPSDVKEDEDKLKELADAIMNSATAIGK
ncbi:MAG: hypothetical protein PHG06_00280 [Parabacteroides sp.]|nr:hypothetical protein [Parabacteroides sp.]